MGAILRFLDGKKSYLVSIAIVGVALAAAAGWITPELADKILILLGAGGLAAVRAGIEKNK